MRKHTFALMMAVALAGCSDGISPSPNLLALDEAAILGFAASYTSDPASRELGEMHRLPDRLKLTDEQQARVNALMATFREATKADREALGALSRQAREAARGGASPEEVKAILAQGEAIRRRLHEAEVELRAAIFALLTDEQKALLESRRERCDGPALSEAQRTEIAALGAAFQEANQADLAAIRSVLEQARAAHKAGASREEVRALIEAARPAMARVRAAERELAVAIQAVLTPEQRAAGCFRMPNPPGPRR
jgi:Spy/CpxP family protein refolding chaperone